jgi:hypothetical protein
MSTSSLPPTELTAKPQESDVSRYKVKLIAEGFGEAEGELIRFQSPMTVDNLAKALPFEATLTLGLLHTGLWVQPCASSTA